MTRKNLYPQCWCYMWCSSGHWQQMPLLMVSSMTFDMFNKIAIRGTPEMAVEKEANSLSRVF